MREYKYFTKLEWTEAINKRLEDANTVIDEIESYFAGGHSQN